MPDANVPAETGDTRIVDNDQAHRYEIYVGETLAGFSTYHLRDDRIVVIHTEIDPEVGRHGLGSQLVKALLDDARRRNLRVVPQCPFVAEYVRTHPEYQDLVA